MDLVSNYIGSLSSAQLGNKSDGNNLGIDLNDNTFENILNNQMNKAMDDNTFKITGELGIPAGLDIGDFDGTKPIFKVDTENKTDVIKQINNTDNSQFQNFKSNDFSASEVLTFFSSIFDIKPTMTQTTDSGLFSFERKLAANSYGKYARDIVTNLTEFVSDALKK